MDVDGESGSDPSELDAKTIIEMFKGDRNSTGPSLAKNGLEKLGKSSFSQKLFFTILKGIGEA